MPDVKTETRYDYPNPINLSVSDEVKDFIVRNHVEPNYILDIKNLFKGKRDWKLVGQVFETTSKALVAIGGIVSFSAGFFDEYYLSFVAGAISTISLATLQFSSFGYKESKKQSIELNTNLKKLKIDEVPVNDRNADDSMMARQSYQAQTMRQSQIYYNPNTEEIIRNMQNNYNYEIQNYRLRIDELVKENEELKRNKDNTPKDNTPKDNTPKNNTPKDNTHKDNTPKDNTPKDNTLVVENDVKKSSNDVINEILDNIFEKVVNKVKTDKEENKYDDNDDNNEDDEYNDKFKVIKLSPVVSKELDEKFNSQGDNTQPIYTRGKIRFRRNSKGEYTFNVDPQLLEHFNKTETL